ncbi:hypothetical protein Tsubulata_011419 [Turnera subulata]|uniref:F-box domain-containing protein n=1 Tax=Turnera subulata TaxID=218843 RepID=A0A9Q0JJP6_9ROSI|nr:hypothetical protein Tsubulata_011419 [Turnera subulata]
MAPISKNYCWTDLPLDLLEKIGSYLQDSYVDILRFRAVCSSWRSSTPLPPIVPSLKTLPPLVPDDNNKSRHCLLKKLTVFSLQPADDLSGATTPLLLRTLPSKPNSKSEQEDHVIPLEALNYPELGAKYLLDTRDFRVKEIWFDHYLEAVDGSSSDNENPTRGVAVCWGDDFDVCMVMVVTPSSELEMWRTGDDSWAFLDSSDKFVSVVYFNEKFFALDQFGRVLAIDAAKPNSVQEISRDPTTFLENCYEVDFVLVKSLGHLFLVFEDREWFMRTLMLDEVKGEWVRPPRDDESRRERLLFVTLKSSFSIVAKDFPEYNDTWIVYFRDHPFPFHGCCEPPNWVQKFLAQEILFTKFQSCCNIC